MIKVRKRNGFIICFLCVVIASVLSVYFGSRKIPFEDIWASLQGRQQDPIIGSIIQTRIYRMLFGMLAGGALGVAGALMQSITRNPIADPSVLGINTGAALAVVIGIAFFNINLPRQYILFALVGGAVTVVFVYFLASVGQDGATPLKLALSGSAVTIVLNSLISTIMLPRSQVMDDFRFWQVGSIGGADLSDIQLAAPYLVLGFALAFYLMPALNTLALGDEMAVGLGVNVKMVRGLGTVASVLLCGTVTAIAGPIAFVGLMIPHVMRVIFGADLRYIVPMSAIGGAVLLTVSDVFGRMLGGVGEIEVGIMTAFIGAPFFILIARKAKLKTE